MLPSKQAEEAIVSTFNETEHDDREEEREDQSGFTIKSILWHGGSVYDAWFSCASNQVHDSQKNPHPKTSEFFIHNLRKEFCVFFWDFKCTGCSGPVDTTILFLSTGYALRHHIADILRHSRKLDCLFNQYSLRGVPKPQGKGKCQLQKPCYSG